jgi:hypothetical protein
MHWGWQRRAQRCECSRGSWRSSSGHYAEPEYGACAAWWVRQCAGSFSTWASGGTGGPWRTGAHCRPGCAAARPIILLRSSSSSSTATAVVSTSTCFSNAGRSSVWVPTGDSAGVGKYNHRWWHWECGAAQCAAAARQLQAVGRRGHITRCVGTVCVVLPSCTLHERPRAFFDRPICCRDLSARPMCTTTTTAPPPQPPPLHHHHHRQVAALVALPLQRLQQMVVMPTRYRLE